MHRTTVVALSFASVLAVAACTTSTGQKPPATQPAPPVSGGTGVPSAPSGPPQRVEDAIPVLTEPALTDDGITARSLEDLNRSSPLQPVFFPLDGADMDEAGRRAASANAEVLKTNASWIVTIEGHCDERGSAEYNLGLGERRAAAVKTYLQSLGIRAERIRTVSYGKEFPFDSGHNEEAWRMNRRAHFVVAGR